MSWKTLKLSLNPLKCFHRLECHYTSIQSDSWLAVNVQWFFERNWWNIEKESTPWKLLVALVLARRHRNAFLHQELCETNGTPQSWDSLLPCTLTSPAETLKTQCLLFPSLEGLDGGLASPLPGHPRDVWLCHFSAGKLHKHDRYATPWSESWEYRRLVLLNKERHDNLWQAAGVFVFGGGALISV